MSDLRVGDAERDRAAADLGEHYALGRLGSDEHAERLDAVWTARTRADLAILFEDLPPRETGPVGRRPARRTGPGARPVPFVPIAILLVVLSVLTHVPLWIGIFFLGCGSFSRARRARRGSRRTSSSASAGW